MDGDMAAEIETSLVPLESELERLQEDALFSGEYDGGDAVVTIQSDAGGTDAQDFTELLLRMYLRWADEPRLQDRSARSQPRRGSRPQVGDLHDRGRERVRDPQGRARQAPPRPPVAVRPGASPAHLVRAGDPEPAPRRRRRDRDRRRRHPRRHLPRERRRRPAREQDRLRGPPHAHPDRASSSASRTSAPSPRTRRPRSRSSAHASQSRPRRSGTPSSPRSAGT